MQIKLIFKRKILNMGQFWERYLFLLSIYLSVSTHSVIGRFSGSYFTVGILVLCVFQFVTE